MNNLYFPSDIADAKRLSKQVSRGQLKRIRNGIYTDAPWDQIPALVQSRWYDIVDYLYNGEHIGNGNFFTLLDVGADKNSPINRPQLHGSDVRSDGTFIQIIDNVIPATLH